jgi:hypothetical protein
VECGLLFVVDGLVARLLGVARLPLFRHLFRMRRYSDCKVQGPVLLIIQSFY